jgi:Zn ribbon nucleic-acid-binding protein
MNFKDYFTFDGIMHLTKVKLLCDIVRMKETLHDNARRFNARPNHATVRQRRGSARAYWESIHWPNGAVCPHCKNNDAKSIWKIEANAKKKIRAGLHQCGKCDKQFTSTIGTIFEDSHIPLRKWLIAFYLNSSFQKRD